MSEHKQGTKRKPRANKKAIRRQDGITWSYLSMGKPQSRIPSAINNRPYRVMQTVDFGTVLTTSSSAPVFASKSFQANDIDQISSFQNLFDQYRIDAVEVWITPQVGANNTLTEYSSVIDFDDATNLTSYAAALDYQNNVETSLSQGHYRAFTPHAATGAYTGSVFTGFENVTAPWCDLNSTTIQHYGLKLAAKTAAVAAPINVVCRYHVSFRNIR